MLHRPSAHEKQRTQIVFAIMRTTQRLPVDRNHFLFPRRGLTGSRLVAGTQSADPILKTSLKCGRFQHCQQTSDRVVGGDSVGQFKIPFQPVSIRCGPDTNRLWPIASCNDGTNRDHNEIAEQVFSIHGASGILDCNIPSLPKKAAGKPADGKRQIYQISSCRAVPTYLKCASALGAFAVNGEAVSGSRGSAADCHYPCPTLQRRYASRNPWMFPSSTLWKLVAL